MSAPTVTLPSVQTSSGLWAPSTPGEATAYCLGFANGHDFRNGDVADAYAEGRREGWRAGRESFAADLIPGLRVAWAGAWAASSPAAVTEVLARPWGEIRARHLANLQQAARRQDWDRDAQQARDSDYRGKEAA